MTDGDRCRAHAAECFRLAILTYDEAELGSLSLMGCQWNDLAVLMDAEERAALKLVIK
jgi:hypothetical protein